MPGLSLGLGRSIISSNPIGDNPSPPAPTQLLPPTGMVASNSDGGLGVRWDWVNPTELPYQLAWTLTEDASGTTQGATTATTFEDALTGGHSWTLELYNQAPDNTYLDSERVSLTAYKLEAPGLNYAIDNGAGCMEIAWYPPMTLPIGIRVVLDTPTAITEDPSSSPGTLCYGDGDYSGNLYNIGGESAGTIYIISSGNAFFVTVSS